MALQTSLACPRCHSSIFLLLFLKNAWFACTPLLDLLRFGKGIDSLLNGPLHGLVCDDEGNGPVEDLAAGAAEGVEDGGVEGAGQRVLTVLGKTVVDNALLGKGACKEDMG